MKKMKDYIVKGKEIFIGLEDSKRTWKISVRSEKLEVHYTSMPAEYQVLKNYLRSNYPRCIVTVMYEAGFKGFGLHDKLVADGHRCIVTPPNKVTQPKDNRVKTDKIDCRRLAINLENGDYVANFVPDAELREDRQVSRTLVAIQKEIVAVRNRIRRLLEFHGIEDGYPQGAWKMSDYTRFLNSSFDGILGTSIAIYQKLLLHLLDTKKALHKHLRELSKKERYSRACEILCSAPGIGRFTAIRLVLEWGPDVSRFENAKKFASFTGLTSREYSTGDTVHRGRITSQSHNFVRSWLIENAWIACSRDPVLMDKFKAVWKNSGSKKKAIVAVARKLAVRLWRCMVNDETYTIGLVSSGC